MTSRYREGQPLGRGAVGEVLEAEDTFLGRTIALKVLPHNAPKRDVDRFRREGRLHAMLTHPNIVPVYDAGELPDGRSFIAMKLIRGRSFGELLEKRKLSRRERLTIFVRLCDAVSYAHAQGVVHRDIKPDNIMVAAHGEVLLVDWGLARGPDGAAPDRPAGARTQLTRVGQILGTPYYMAPELAQGQGRHAGPPADVFSLGAVLYTLLSGMPPYDSVDLYEVVTRVATGEVRPLEQVTHDVPEALHRIVRNAMALEIDDRYASVEALQQAVVDHLAGPSSVRPSWATRMALVGVAAVLIVVLGISVGALVLALALTVNAP